MLNIARTAPFKAVNYFTFDRLMAALVARCAGAPPPGATRYLAGACSPAAGVCCVSQTHASWLACATQL